MTTVDPQIAQLLVDTSADCLVALDEGGRILAWNWGAEQTYGYTRDEAVGRTVQELTVPFDRRDELYRSLREASETGSSIFESVRRRKDGTPLQMQIIIKSAPQGSAKPVLLVSERDITEQKRFEQILSEQVWSLSSVQTFLQSILDGSNDYSIIVVDLEGKILEWNAGATNDFGFPAEEVKGQVCRPLATTEPGNLTDPFTAAFEKAIRDGRFEGEMLGVRKDGATFPARVTVNLRKGPYNDPVGFIILLRNVSEEKRAEAERRLAQERLTEIKRLEEVNSIKTQLLNTASHELNTPLMPITLQLHMLTSGKLGRLDDPQQRAVDVLGRNVERLRKVIEEVIEVARLQSGRLRVEPRRIPLGRLILDAIEDYRLAAEQAGLQLEFAPGDALHVMGDEDRLHQVLANLLDNALKATPKGGRIDVRVARSGTLVRVEVEDTGRGIPIAAMDRLFQPFSQIHDTMQETRAGAGLGLYLCKGIVEQHGGHVEARSQGLGQGATFSFTLPVAPEAESGAPASLEPGA